MAQAETAPFFEHIRELRRRIMWSLLFIGVGAGVGYYLYEKLLYVLQLPYGHELYYTTPTGALSFLIKVCLTFGFIVGLPMLTYQLLAFIAPIAKMHTRRIIALYLLASVSLAAAGIGFAYFVSLPAALHFLVNFGNPDSVQALITANEYFNFVLSYLAGFAVLFQIPLIMMGVNRITPQKPLKLLKGTKYVVLLSFIVAAILTPTPDPFNQAIMAGPMIVLYLASIGLVAVFGRQK
jgi:sec-independent protein translocase protein TatC